MQGLQGMRVLELGDMVSASLATRMMADLGADVIKVEAPGGDRARHRGPYPRHAEGDPEQSGLYLALNTNKRGAVLDLEREGDRAHFDGLVRRSDVLVHNLAPQRLAALGVEYEKLRSLRPELVVCAITPFGLEGPRSQWSAEELTVQHGGGWGWLSPGQSDFPDRAPLKAFGHQCDIQSAIAANAATMAAWYRALRTGHGEHIDLSQQAYVASFIEIALIYWTYPGVVATRQGARGLQPWGIFPCRDGLIFLATPEEDQWDRLKELMGHPEWSELEIFQDMKSRMQNYDALRIFLQEWTTDWEVETLFHEAQKRRICFAPVLGLEDFGRQPQLRARDYFVPVEHPVAGSFEVIGAPYRLREPWWSLRTPSPTLGQHQQEVLAESAEAPAAAEAPQAMPESAGARPLEGIKVLDLSWVWAGPFGAMHLAHLGAEVIKVESEGRPDLGRRLAVYSKEHGRGLNRSGYFNQWNQGKRSVALNLAEPEAVEIVRELAAHCDVLIENFATGVMERLGLAYEVLQERNPDLIMASISGYGETGPLRDYMGYGPAIMPLSGLSAASGYRGEGPSEVGLSLGDPCAGITATAAICSALAARERNGGGQHIDVSLWESTAVGSVEPWMAWQLRGEEPERMENRDPLMSPHGVFRSAGDDAWVTIACPDDDAFRALASVVDPSLAEDPRFASDALRKQNEDALEERIEAWTAERDRWEAAEALQAVGVAAFPCMTPRDVAEDEQLWARGFFETLEHPEVGRRQHAGVPWRLANGPNGVAAPAPCLGADTESVFRDVLGYPAERIRDLVERKIAY